ncbi:MAG: hypothetical protein JO001_13530 [Alphaproteobacteria bacterium]|nr:hypothetical protein [Alphaproteobacteria bacterium]
MSDRAAFLSRIVLPIAWERMAHAPSLKAQRAAQIANTGALAFLLRNIEIEANQRPPDERMAEALAPLHGKLDMLTEMLSHLCYRDTPLPPAQEIEFGVGRIAWSLLEPVRPYDWMRFKLYFHPTLLEPVILDGQVTDAAPEADGTYRAEAELVELPEEASDALARLAFLAHRRQLARRPAAVSVAAAR